MCVCVLCVFVVKYAVFVCCFSMLVLMMATSISRPSMLPYWRPLRWLLVLMVLIMTTSLSNSSSFVRTPAPLAAGADGADDGDFDFRNYKPKFKTKSKMVPDIYANAAAEQSLEQQRQKRPLIKLLMEPKKENPRNIFFFKT